MFRAHYCLVLRSLGFRVYRDHEASGVTDFAVQYALRAVGSQR